MNKNVRNERFTMLMNEDERNMLTELAKVMYRSQGDTVRQLLYLEAKRLRKEGVKFPEDIARYIDSLPDPDKGLQLVAGSILGVKLGE